MRFLNPSHIFLWNSLISDFLSSLHYFWIFFSTGKIANIFFSTQSLSTQPKSFFINTNFKLMKNVMYCISYHLTQIKTSISCTNVADLKLSEFLFVVIFNTLCFSNHEFYKWLKFLKMEIFSKSCHFFSTSAADYDHVLHWINCFNWFAWSIMPARVGKIKFLTRHLR